MRFVWIGKHCVSRDIKSGTRPWDESPEINRSQSSLSRSTSEIDRLLIFSKISWTLIIMAMVELLKISSPSTGFDVVHLRVEAVCLLDLISSSPAICSCTGTLVVCFNAVTLVFEVNEAAKVIWKSAKSWNEWNDCVWEKMEDKRQRNKSRQSKLIRCRLVKRCVSSLNGNEWTRLRATDGHDLIRKRVISWMTRAIRVYEIEWALSPLQYRRDPSTRKPAICSVVIET